MIYLQDNIANSEMFMDFRSLQLFNHLATSLHFGVTAEAMYVSPSTLSRVIQRLEDELGCSLFKRDNRKSRIASDKANIDAWVLLPELP